MCIFRFTPDANALLHKLHLYGFSPVWVLVWHSQIISSVQMLCDTNCTCMAFLQCGFLYGIPDCSSVQMLCDINCTCMAFLQCGFLYGIPDYSSVQMFYDINCTCMAFLQCGFLYGIPDYAFCANAL